VCLFGFGRGPALVDSLVGGFGLLFFVGFVLAECAYELGVYGERLLIGQLLERAGYGRSVRGRCAQRCHV
jgi:uncharacterized membrane protein YGL010W